MASLRVSGGAGAAAAASQRVQVVTTHRHSFFLPNQQLPSNSNLRFKNAARLQVRQTLFTALASNSNPTGTGPHSNTNDAPQGPPLLTIVAGFLVFGLVSWIAGSTVTSLIGFIVRLFPSK